MLRRRLYLQIYATIIASLVLVVVITGALFEAFGPRDFDERVFGITGKLIFKTLPPASASLEEQTRAVRELGNEFRVRISLFDRNKNLIAANGRPSRPPKKGAQESGWHRHGGGPSWALRLPDDRWFVVQLGGPDRRRPLVGLLLLLGGITLAIAIASYPFVRRLTRRLEDLQAGVEKIGEGDLTARVKVQGKDEIANLANSFNKAAETIQKLVNSNRQLLANASHELRTPLARVRLGVEMMQNGGTPSRRAALERDIAELDSLIDEILLMSRLDTGNKPNLSHQVDLLALLAEECAHYDTCVLDGVPADVLGNEKLLRRLVRNLLDNAVKHGQPPIDLRLKTNADTAVLHVCDSGDGIAPHQRDHIFEPFHRAPGKQNVEGYGLGLALVRQIAGAHGGTVKFVDLPGETSVFEVVLPLAP